MLQRLTGVGVAAILLGMLSLSGRAMSADALVPTMTGVVPNMTDLAGGEVVEITGTNFVLADITALTIDGQNVLPSLKVISTTKIQVTTPASTNKGPADIVITDATAPLAPVTLTGGVTYTKHNRVLQVSVHMTIAQQVKIAWGDGTDNDDAGTAHASGDIEPFVWIVSDPEFLPATQVNLGDTYTTDDGTGGSSFAVTADATNAQTLNVINVSQTGSAVDISAVCSNSVPSVVGSPSWSPAAGAGTDTFEMEAQMLAASAGTASAAATLGNVVAVQLYNELPKSPTAGPEDPSRLHLQVSTPTETTITATTTHIVTVSLVGAAD